MANNFGLGSRDMVKAGKFALINAARAGHKSFLTARTLSDRWRRFVNFIRENGIKKMELIDRNIVIEYGKDLLWRVEEGLMSAATAQNYVSAVNTVMDLATQGKWVSVSPVKDCFISQRDFIRTSIPSALDRMAFDAALASLYEEITDRGLAVIELCREFGLRSKEASLLDVNRGLREALQEGFITISAGTKGGRVRTVQILTEQQLYLLKRAAEIQGQGKSLMPIDQDWKSWREGELREIREALQKVMNGDSLRDLRAAYACQRYKELTGHDAPVLGGKRVSSAINKAARLVIARELGHGRIDVTNSYVGSSR